jgi:hypothetical protein
VLEDAVVDELLGRAGGGAASLKAQRAAEEAERKAKLDALDKIYKAIRVSAKQMLVIVHYRACTDSILYLFLSENVVGAAL